LRKVFLDDLPKYNYGNNTHIDWNKSIGYKINFIYDNTEGELEIVDYQSKGQFLYVKYLDNDIYKILTGSFCNCNLGELLGKYTYNFKVEIGHIFKDEKRDLIIIDREYKLKKEKTREINYKYYKYKCNKCGWEEGWIVESQLLKGGGCSCCYGRTTVVGINDIPTTAPWMIKYFQGGYDEAKLYTKTSNNKIIPICPDCGNIKDKELSISIIHKNKSIGCLCSDGKSYPEKVMYSVLTQLNIEFIVQLNKVLFEWCLDYKYDFYIPKVNIIIETHGKQHYEEPTINSKYNKSLTEQQEVDKIKYDIAKQNGINDYIIINCKNSELKWIKNEILNSYLSKYFDLSVINWDKVEEFALSNLVKKACEIKKENNNLTTFQIGKIMNLSYVTITKYLKQGTKLGWCNYNPKEESLKGVRLGGKPVCIYKDNVLLGEFKSCGELARNSKILFGVNLLVNKISSVCNGKRKTHKGFTFKYIKAS